MDISDSTAPD